MKKRYGYTMKYGVRIDGKGPMFLLVIRDGKVDLSNGK